MVRQTNLLKMAALVLAVFACTAASARAAANPNGDWKWSFNRNGMDLEFTLTLKAEGEKLTGTLSLPQGLSADVKDGTFKNDEVNFEIVFEFNGNMIKTKYKGKVDGDTIKGKTERERDGEVMMRDWEAKRDKK